MKILRKTLTLLILCMVIVISETSQGKSAIYRLLPGCTNEPFQDEISVYPSYEDTQVYAIGYNLRKSISVGFTNDTMCKHVIPIRLTEVEETNSHFAVLDFTTPSTGQFMFQQVWFYICIWDPESKKWILQDHSPSIGFYVYESFKYDHVLYIILAILSFSLSSLITGVQSGHILLGQDELNVLKNAGTEREKQCANKIIPVRKNGNFLLCGLVLMCTLCNSVATVCVDCLINSGLAVLLTTIVILLFCRILPQSICMHFPIPIIANTGTLYVTRACMWVTAPVSYPLSVLLNYTLGKELHATYTKDRLRELLKMADLQENEVIIISGAFDLSKLRVEEVMTPLDNIFLLPITAVLDYNTVTSILASGYSRIPICDRNRSNIRHVLLVKELALIEPHERLPIKSLVQKSKYECKYLPVGTTLDIALNVFEEGRGHMMFVVDEKKSSDEKGMNVVGLITFNDIVEQIFKFKFIDKTDDNRYKRMFSAENETIKLLSVLTINFNKIVRPTISESMKLAVFYYLSAMDIFFVENVSPNILFTILNMSVYYTTLAQRVSREELVFIYITGVPADYFVLILEGQMEVKFGSEELLFEVGPFRYFGSAILRQALLKTENVFKPDFTLQTASKTVYLKITKALYEAALLATRYERFNEVPDDVRGEVKRYFMQLVGKDAAKSTPMSGIE